MSAQTKKEQTKLAKLSRGTRLTKMQRTLLDRYVGRAGMELTRALLIAVATACQEIDSHRRAARRRRTEDDRAVARMEANLDWETIGSIEMDCATCKGTGNVWQNAQERVWGKCPDCNGTGTYNAQLEKAVAMVEAALVEDVNLDRFLRKSKPRTRLMLMCDNGGSPDR